MGKSNRERKESLKKASKYVRNKDLLPELKKFKATGEMSEELGEMLLLMAKKISNRGNFRSYTWRDEMVMDSLLNCMKYLHNFDPDKSNNAFSYVTTMLMNSMKNYIKYQGKHSQIKDALYNSRLELLEVTGYCLKGIDYECLKD